MTNPHPQACLLEQQMSAAVAKLQEIDAQGLARKSGFLVRSERKIPMPKFLQGLLSAAATTDLSLEHLASLIGLAAQTSYTKQALSERLSHEIKPFLAQVVVAALGGLSRSVETSPLLAPLARVLVQDSTIQSLPQHLAPLFPGVGNQNSTPCASLKVQWICDLKNSAVEHVSLSGVNRNDQAAASDILQVARPGDLVLRDLGYFVTGLLGRLTTQGVFFLTRLLHGTKLYDPQTGQPLDLAARLRTTPHLDLQVLAGAERVPLRLVALPVPEEVANLRRHKARASAKHRRRPPPGKERLFLMGWTLLLTNLPSSTWKPKALVALYRLRWRMEIIFKTWKSYLGLPHLNCRSAVLLELSVLTKLLFCALVCQVGDMLELTCAKGRHVSLLRLAHILGQCACWFSALVLGLSVSQWLQFRLTHHAFYDQRKDRRNYYQLLAGTDSLA
jgi:hypothetical protein